MGKEPVASGGAGEDTTPGTSSRLPPGRIKAIAQQDRDMGALANDAVERMSTAAQDLLRELIRGGLQVARERQSGKGGAGKGSGGVEGSAGPVIIQPEDICAFVASEERLAFLRRVTGPASKQAGFLDSYRARTKAAAGVSSKRRRVASGGGAGKALAGLAGAGEDEDEDEEGGGEYEDEEVEGAFLKEKEGGNEVRKGALALDEDYDDE